MALIEFQNFSGGSNDSTTVSWPVAGHATITSGAQGGGYYSHFNATDATIQGSDPSHYRVHNWGFPSTPSWYANGNTVWRTLTVRVPSGHTGEIFAGDEVHQETTFGTTGPAPFNMGHDGIGNRWYLLCRGGNNHGVVGDPFTQTVFGRASTSNGTLVPFSGGPRLVVADQWVSFIYGWLFDYQGNGWFEAYMRAPTDGNNWINVVPRYSNIYTSYNNTLYPMSSMYGDVGSGNTYLIDYCNGAYSNSFTEILNFANTENGFSTGTVSSLVRDSRVSGAADSNPPTAVSAYGLNGSIVVTMNETLNTSSVPATSAFTLHSGGGTVSITNISMSSNQVTLVVPSGSFSGTSTLTLDYAKPGTNPILDTDGFATNSFSSLSVKNLVGRSRVVKRTSSVGSRIRNSANRTRSTSGGGF